MLTLRLFFFFVLSVFALPSLAVIFCLPLSVDLLDAVLELMVGGRGLGSSRSMEASLVFRAMAILERCGGVSPNEIEDSRWAGMKGDLDRLREGNG